MDLTPKELYLALKQKNEYDEFSIRSVIRPVCEVIRLEAYWLVNLQLSKNKKIKDPRKMVRFEWDAVIKERQSREEMMAVMRNIVMDTKSRKSSTPNTPS